MKRAERRDAIVTRYRAAVPYVALAFTALAVAFAALRLWEADAHVLLKYTAGDDTMFTATFVKAMLDHGWYYFNPSLGAPMGADWHDFPQPSLWHFLVLRALGSVVPDYAAVINTYYVASYPLAALAAFYALRRTGVSASIAAACALLFAFIPDHFLRGEAHLFYGLLYVVPLTVLMVCFVSRGEPLWIRTASRSLPAPTPTGWFALAVALVTGWDNQYHAIFAMAFLAVASCIGFVRSRSVAPLAGGMVLGGVVGLALLLQVLPTIAFDATHGKHAAVPVRQFAESEVFALKLTHLVLPAANHQLAAFAAKKREYDRATATDDLAASFPALGVLGTLGFFGLFAVLLMPRRPPAYGPVLHDVAALNLTAFLLGTVGGLGALIALFVTPEIRAYGRISPFISWFALIGLAIFLEILVERCAAPVRRRLLRLAVAAAVAGWGLFDQISPAYGGKYAAKIALHHSDAALVARIASAVPPGSRIFEVPYVPFPEGAPVNALPAYGQLRPYLHSNTLRWSGGALGGTAADALAKSVAALPLSSLPATIAHDGFAGVLVFRAGYADNGSAVEAALRAVTQTAPIASPAGDLAFFALRRPPGALDDDALTRSVTGGP